MKEREKKKERVRGTIKREERRKGSEGEGSKLIASNAGNLKHAQLQLQLATKRKKEGGSVGEGGRRCVHMLYLLGAQGVQHLPLVLVVSLDFLHALYLH